MKEKKQTGILPILGMLALILVLFGGVKLIFSYLEETVVPQRQNETPRYTIKAPEGGDSGYTMLPVEEDIPELEVWLDEAEEEGGHWLFDPEEQKGVLYLPAQDRTFTPQDVTATREKGENGMVHLVLRIRTAEDSQTIDPKEQLWAVEGNDPGLEQLQVILDGREQTMHYALLVGGSIYNLEP